MGSGIVQKDAHFIKGMKMLEFHIDGVVPVIVIEKIEKPVSRFSDLDLIFFGINHRIIYELLHVRPL